MTGTLLGRSALRIGFLDDVPQFLSTIAAWQEELGLEPRTTDDASTLLEWVRRRDIDVAVADLRMPGDLDGIAILERARTLNANIPLYLLTAYALNREQEARVQAIGAATVSKLGRLQSFFEALVSQQPSAPRSGETAAGRRATARAADSIEMQVRIDRLEAAHREWVSDLLESLERIPSKEASQIVGTDSMSIAQLIDEIRQLSPKGLEYIRLWRQALNTVRRRKGERR